MIVASQRRRWLLREIAWSVLVLIMAAAASAALAGDASVRDLIVTAADVGAEGEIRDHALGAVVGQGSAAVPALLDLLNDPKANLRAMAANALGRISLDQGDERAIGPLTHLFQHDADLTVRMNAALALGMTGNPRAAPPLVAALDTNDVPTRRIVAVALFQLNRPETVEPVVQRLQKETDPEIQRNLIRTLGNVGAREQLEALRRSQTDPALLGEVEQQIGVATMQQDLKGTATREVPRAHTLYGFFAGAQAWLLPGAYVLLLVPTVLFGLWSFLSAPMRDWPRRLGIALLGVVVAIIVGGIASLPGFSAGLGRPDPGPGVAILVLPFFLALSTTPVVLCACFVRLAARSAWNETMLNTAIWAGVYALLQFGTWHLVPLVLRGNYFYYGRHPGWHATQIGYTIGVAVTCAIVGTVHTASSRTGAARPWLDTLKTGAFAALMAPCVLMLGVGYLIANIYAY